MDDVLYRDEILDHYYDSAHRGRLESPDRVVELDNPLCGDRIRLELRIGPGGRIDRVRFEGQGCVISQASASLLASRVEGLPADEAAGLPADEAAGLLGVPLSPGRLKCGLLAWRALQHAMAGPQEPVARAGG